MRILIFLVLLLTSFACARKSYLRSPSSHHSKYQAFTPGTKIKLVAAVPEAHKEESIYKDSKCEVFKYCRFEIGNDPLRKLTMRGEFLVDSINEDEDKLILITQDLEKIQLDCGLKYTMKKISVENDRYCEKLTREFTIYTFPEFMQTIVDMEITYNEPESIVAERTP